VATDLNRAVIRRIFDEGFNKRNLSVLDEVIAPEYVNHDMLMSRPGPEGFKEVVRAVLRGFPDIAITIDDVVSDGDRVATRGHFVGTHKGEFMGIPPTGRRVDVSFIDVWRLVDGKAVENWVRLNTLGLIQVIAPAMESAKRRTPRRRPAGKTKTPRAKKSAKAGRRSSPSKTAKKTARRRPR
jgi:predicted ester cyclase